MPDKSSQQFLEPALPVSVPASPLQALAPQEAVPDLCATNQPPGTCPSDTKAHPYFRMLDRLVGGLRARSTQGVSPTSLFLALSDWAINLAGAPGKQADLALTICRDTERLFLDIVLTALDAKTPLAFTPEPGEQRFKDPAWNHLPYRFWLQTYLRSRDWWRQTAADVPGLSPHHSDIVTFVLEQVLVALSPANNLVTNPEIIQKIIETGGRNFLDGGRNLVEDITRLIAGQMPAGTEAYKVGETVAVTPGKVVLRNRLIELIQYAPETENVKAEPILIVPAWIMKYYILDLSPHNSLIAYLVGKGHTVFCISWHNVTSHDRNLSLEDYRLLGVMAALEAVNHIVPGRLVHAVGYCLGGTLLSLAAAAMAEIGDERLASITLLAAQTDFTEPGPLQVFIDENEINSLESLMWEQGNLHSSQMATAFELLRPNDLVYAHIVQDYFLGERRPMLDLMAWNADATRMPYRMHSEYLRKFYLNNDLASGRYMIEGRTIAIQNIRVPIFAVGTERDHVAPWKSVYKIHYLNDGDITFVLTKGGHNAGIVSEPGHKDRSFRISHRRVGDTCLSQEEWEVAARPRQGSWWIAWEAWLTDHSAKVFVAPPSMGAPRDGYPPLANAPGSYVLET
ncbi:PHA/PHB synthase family protein [Beijerinckia indica]|uniref:Poly-beta-hydroxybutyrate polymerase domain protein n=1 Tax=Beijerinckia indica subsp. indica (strain ATCC 9039 / DSM 1715 / NCIMB 8712) TaxID=395963 RepID=B2IGQ9_BEII9|nr:alpha/beta fold hydrolase [Beijerinckia indica]ACB95820.1 Poly-beta-hydroxybutyrate polymerase domain protein [Beijerinckia indica subsp. indica ATCC 9039]